MKYWIFQSNQVLGPYEPDDLSRHSAFGAESLVCPEGRRGTSMGDWQRAGMVPDLTVALVRASQASPSKTSVATLAGLPPEPTLKDLAVLGSLQEKMTLLEDVVLQLQEGLRLKDAELAELHKELAGKERQSSVIKTAMERDAEARRHEAETLKSETGEFKRKMQELEERLGAVNRLSETIEKAVEAEKNVEHDVETQGATLAELSKEIEALRAQMSERLTAPPPPEPSPFAPPAPAAGTPPVSAWPTPKSLAPAPSLEHEEMPAIAPSPAQAEAPATAPMPTPIPAPDLHASVPMPFAPLETPAPGDLPNIAPPPPATVSVSSPSPDPEPAQSLGLIPDFMPNMAPGSDAAHGAESSALPSFGNPINPMGSMPIPGSPEAIAADEAAAAAASVATDLTVTPPKSRKKALIFGALFGVLALGAIAVFKGRLNLMGARKSAPALSDVPPAMPVHAPPPALPTPPPAPVVDPRETAIDAAKEWELPDGRTLGQALETLSPPAGNLSPWMAEPSTTAENRVSVNYFAQPNTPGAPTVAYQFEVDLAEKTLVGRNPAAKAVLAGKAVPPPAPPKPKPVKIKPKAKAKAAPPQKKEENLDSLLGADAPAPKAEATPAQPAPKPAATTGSAPAGDDAPVEAGDAPATDAAPAAETAPAKPTTAKRAAKASKAAAAAPPAAAKASDESLLDDILKE